MVQLQFINKLLDTQDTSIIIKNNLTEDYFSNYINEYVFINEHINKYNKIPDKQTFLEKFPNFDIIVVSEDFDYLISELYKDKNWRAIQKATREIPTLYAKDDLDAALNKLRSIVETADKTKHLEVKDILQDTNERYEIFLDKIGNLSKHYIHTGFKELDRILGGWDRQEELATIAARTNQGKTWILLKAAAAAIEQGLKVGIYSGEMDVTKIAYRIDTLLAKTTNISLSNYGLTHGNREIQNKYKSWLDSLTEKYPSASCKILTPAMIDGPAGVNALRSFIEKENIDILFVDQHSLLEDDRKGRTPIEKASNISRDLKNLQVMKKIPIITASQLNREKNETGSPDTTNISQSDRIGQDSTTIIMFEQDKEHKLMTMHLVKSRDSVNGLKLTYSIDLDKGEFVYMPDESDALDNLPVLPVDESMYVDNELNEDVEWETWD